MPGWRAAGGAVDDHDDADEGEEGVGEGVGSDGMTYQVARLDIEREFLLLQVLDGENCVSGSRRRACRGVGRCSP